MVLILDFFFSFFIQGVLTFLAVKRYRQGINEDFSTPYDPSNIGGGTGGLDGGPQQQSPYSQYASGSAAGESGDPYQQSPFGQNQQQTTATTGDYNPPTY